MRKEHLVLVGLLITCTAVIAAEQRSGGTSESPEVVLKAAMHRELMDGDLNASIKEYQAIVHKYERTDRRVAAQALLRMAGAYQKLGDGHARRVYERIVRDFGDQPAATEARIKFASGADGPLAIPRSARSINSISVWSGPKVGVFGGGQISRDGRWLPYTDWSTGDLMLHDLTTGRDRQLTDAGLMTSVRDQQYAGYSRVSPDGKWVAFGWFNSQRYEIRLVDLQTDGVTRARTLYSNPEAKYIQPFDWAPDARSIVVELQRPDRSGQIALVDVQSGTLKPLTTFDWRDESTNLVFSPDGRYIAYDLRAEDTPGERDVFVLAADGTGRSQITSHPKNDQLVGWARDGSRLIFSSDRTGSVQLWAQQLAGLELRGSAHVIPSDFTGQVVGVVGDTIYDLKTTYGGSPFRTVSFDFGTSRATSAPLDPAEELFSINYQAQLEWSPDGRSLAVVRRDRGGPVGMLVSILDLETRKISNVRPQLSQLGNAVVWDPGGRFLYAVGSDLKERWALFRITLDSGTATRVGTKELQPASGLALAPSGSDVYFRRVTDSTVTLVARQFQSGAERELLSQARPTNGVSDFFMRPYVSPDGRRIASVKAFSPTEDGLTAIDIESGTAKELLRGPFSGLTILMWAPDSASLFIRRSVAAGQPEVLRVPIDGGSPAKVDWTLGHDSREFRVHPDGQRVAYVLTKVASQSEVRALTNVLAGATSKSSK